MRCFKNATIFKVKSVLSKILLWINIVQMLKEGPVLRKNLEKPF